MELFSKVTIKVARIYFARLTCFMITGKLNNAASTHFLSTIQLS